MIRKALRRANRSYLFFVVSALLFVAGFAGSTFAYFDGQTQLTATYAGGYVVPVTSPAATASGYDGVVTWSPPAPITTTVTTPTTTYVQTTTPGVSALRILAMDNGSTTNCNSVTYTTTVVTNLSKTQSTYTDSNRTASSGNGDQWCYSVQSYPNAIATVTSPYTTPFTTVAATGTNTVTTPTGWYQQANAAVAQLGLAVKSVVAADSTTSDGSINNGDTIKLTFNQKPASPANGTICTFQGASGNGVILVGDSTCSNKSTDPWVVAKFTGITVGGAANSHQKLNASASVSSSAPWVMTISITQNGQTVSGWSSASFTPSTSVKSAATTDQATVCTSGGSNCAPTPSGAF